MDRISQSKVTGYMDVETNIDLEMLSNGLPGITQRIGSFLAEASGFCLQLNTHSPGTIISIEGFINQNSKLIWKENTDQQLTNSYADEKEAVEFGACGIAIAIIEKLTSYTVIRRSWIGTGFDYWLGEKDSDLPFDEKARLEISGIMHGSNDDIRHRANIKINQTRQSDNLKLPAIIVITEFSRPASYLVKR